MKIHNGRFENAFVLEVDVCESPAWEVDYGEVQIYPDTATGVEALALNTEQFKEGGSVEWCYWVHAMDAVRKEQSATCNVKLTVAGKTYSVGAGIDGLPRCDFDVATGILRFPDGELPELQRVTPGTMARIVATIPERNGNTLKAKKNTEASMVYDLPMLKGTMFYYSYYKGEKKVSAGMRLTVVGLPSEDEIYYGKGQKNGHKRTAQNGKVPPGGTGDDETVWRSHDEWKKGDKQVKLTINPFNNSSPLAYPIWPAFTRTWDVPVRGILFSQAER